MFYLRRRNGKQRRDRNHVQLGSGRSRNTQKFRVKGKLPLNDVYCCKCCGLPESDDSGCPIFTPFILADSVLPTALLCQDFPRLSSFANNQANNANQASKAPCPTCNLGARSHSPFSSLPSEVKPCWEGPTKTL